MSNPFHFGYKKASQAVAALLRSEPHRRMNYYRLLKLLYIADRQSLKETGRPIIGGRLVAMERGPLHSAGFDLVTGKDPEIAWWSQFFTTERHELVMLDDPGNGELSKREIDLLNRVSQEHESQDEWEVGKVTHEFQEFIANKPAPGSVKTIPFEDVLSAIGRQGDLDAILKDAKTKSVFDQVFGP